MARLARSSRVVVAFPLHRVRRNASSTIFSAIRELDEHDAQFRAQCAWFAALGTAVMALSALVTR